MSSVNNRLKIFKSGTREATCEEVYKATVNLKKNRWHYVGNNIPAYSYGFNVNGNHCLVLLLQDTQLKDHLSITFVVNGSTNRDKTKVADQASKTLIKQRYFDALSSFLVQHKPTVLRGIANGETEANDKHIAKFNKTHLIPHLLKNDGYRVYHFSNKEFFLCASPPIRIVAKDQLVPRRVYFLSEGVTIFDLPETAYDAVSFCPLSQLERLEAA
jgi:hypothetical protein